MAEAPVWFVTYMGQMIRPAGLAVIYTHHEESLRWWPAALALIGVLIPGNFSCTPDVDPWLWMGWLWNLGMLVPVSGIVQISRHARADHYNYLPQIGLYIGLTWMAAEWSQGGRYRRAVLAVVAAVVLSLLMAVAYRQASWWRNSVTVWTHTIQCTTDNFVAHCALGYALYLEGRTGEAIFQYRESLRINPAYPLTYYNLGVALAAQGKTEEAIAQYRESLRINSASPLTHYNLGVALAAQGKTEEAIAQFHEALRINPGYTDAHNNLGNALARQGKTEEAIAQFHEALRIDPAFIGALNNLGIALARQGKTNEAIAQFHEALRIDSAYPETLNNLGLTLDRQGQTAEAIARYREALRINPRYTDAQTNLGNALLEQGQIEEAILDYREAVRIDPSDIVARNCLGFALSCRGKRRQPSINSRKPSICNPPISRLKISSRGSWPPPRNGPFAMAPGLLNSQPGPTNQAEAPTRISFTHSPPLMLRQACFRKPSKPPGKRSNWLNPNPTRNLPRTFAGK